MAQQTNGNSAPEQEHYDFLRLGEEIANSLVETAGGAGGAGGKYAGAHQSVCE